MTISGGSRLRGSDVGARVLVVASRRGAVCGSDIVSAATNTVDPVIEGRWLEDGMHVTSLVGGDGFLPRKELDDDVITRALLIVVGYKPQIFIDKQAEFHDRLARGIVGHLKATHPETRYFVAARLGLGNAVSALATARVNRAIPHLTDWC